MKATELRIGNYIRRRTNNDHLEVDLRLLESIQRQPNFFKPIELTEEWLKDFGITKKLYGDYILYEDEFILFNYNDVQKYWYVITRNDDVVTTFKYVHQLQNLYFAITGKELSL